MIEKIIKYTSTLCSFYLHLTKQHNYSESMICYGEDPASLIFVE